MYLYKVYQTFVVFFFILKPDGMMIYTVCIQYQKWSRILMRGKERFYNTQCLARMR